MKRNLIARTAAALALTGIIVLSPSTAAMASTDESPNTAAMAGTDVESPAIARTKAWDSIKNTLGGLPESVNKIEYMESTFYLGKDVTEADFLAVLTAGPEAVKLKPPIAANVSRLYFYPVYILWNADKTVLLVHPISYANDDILEAVAILIPTPESVNDLPVKETPKAALTAEQEYMLTVEYADALRNEFYRLINEHREAHGLRALEIDLELQRYADIRADEQRIRFGHTRPDGSYAGSGWYNSYNHMGSRYAENALKTGAIGKDPLNTAKGIFSLWKASKGHNAHMLYDFGPHIKMALGIAPRLDDDGFITSGAIFASGYHTR